MYVVHVRIALTTFVLRFRQHLYCDLVLFSFAPERSARRICAKLAGRSHLMSAQLGGFVRSWPGGTI